MVNKMNSEDLKPNRGTKLRKNGSKPLKIDIEKLYFTSLMVINEHEFLTDNITSADLIISVGDHYMIINKSERPIHIEYNTDITHHEVIYDPYKYEHTQKKKIDPDKFQTEHDVLEGFIDILPKWYSIKFTYPEYNLIFIKPEMGISFQTHQERSETWEILSGQPIVLNDNHVYYYVNSGTRFTTPKQSYHSIINPNEKGGEYVVFKEQWNGNFDEQDITRVFNPNHYSD
ncbi:MAG: Mannose-6-phosphate isomerase [Promethearchaeota archaeon]|jgi:mannose-6-phosphate isomerase-like protein (cupin superfamily)|nr:MAG: Mannose-6-phosphate isomerase [Candidatus Lokiarchaeota archaeon]